MVFVTVQSHMGSQQSTTGEQGTREVVHVEHRPVRNIGGCIGVSLCRDALERVELLEDGELTEDVEARQVFFSDGSFEIRVDGDR